MATRGIVPRANGEGSIGTTVKKWLSGFFVNLTATGTITGNLTGNVTGNVSGNVTGDVNGNVTGSLTGNVTGDVTGNAGGNAGTATKLATARKIGGSSFDGTADISVNPVTIINETQVAGTAGGTFTSGAWRTRTLNTILKDNIGITLSSNQITLPAGKYVIDADAPAFRVDSHAVRIQNITDSTTVAIGTSEYSNNTAGYGQNRSFVTGFIEISAAKTFELQHVAATTFSSSGFGNAISGVTSVFSKVKITKVG